MNDNNASVIKKKRFKSINKDYCAYLFIAPFVIVFLIFGLYPIIYTFKLSFTNTALMRRGWNYVGFENYVSLFKDPVFFKALKNTWGIWLLNFIPQLGLGLVLSVWLTSTRLRIKGNGFWRAVYYLPNLLMPATISVLFGTMFSFYGPANKVLVGLGLLSESVNFMNGEAFARGLVIFIQTWMWFGNTLVVLYAGMTSISPDFYEAAMVDGAKPFYMFRKITLPCLKPIMVYTLVTSLVGGLQIFDIPFLLSKGRGDPNNAIMTLNMLMIKKYNSSKGLIGAASAVGIVVLIITTVVAIAIFYLLGDKDARYERKLARKEKVSR